MRQATLSVTLFAVLTSGGLALATPSSAPSPLAGKGRLHFKGRTHDLYELPTGLTSGSQRLIAKWRGFVSEKGYTMHVDERQSVVYLTAKTKNRARRDTKLLAATLNWFDEHLAAPDRDENPLSGKRQGIFTGGIPRGELKLGTPSGDPVLLINVDSGDDYAALLALLEKAYPYLSNWIKGSSKTSGFVLGKPVCGAWIENLDGQEEWSSKHELVHRLTELLCLRDFGQLPVWLQQGLAWRAEDALHGDLYSFPYRDEFVDVTAHGGWGKALRRSFRARKDGLSMSELTAYERGTFQLETAQKAFGMAGYLLRYHGENAGALIAAFGKAWDEGSRITATDGTWTRNVDYQVGSTDQADLIRRYTADAFLEQVTQFFRKGKSYRPKRR